MMKIGVVGCGNMSSALIPSIFENSDDLTFMTYTPSKCRAKSLASIVDGIYCENIEEIYNADILFLGHKPQQLLDVNKKFKNKKFKAVISILAGVSTDEIIKLYQTESVLRIMPNTPSLVGEGVNGLYFTPSFNNDLKIKLINIFEKFSLSPVFKDESKIDMITPFSGSGPAYIFEFARIFINKLESFGIDKDQAKKIVVKTFLGSSKMLDQSDLGPEVLRENVTSKNGVTYEALEIFKDNNLQTIFDKAIDRAYDRCIELKNGE